MRAPSRSDSHGEDDAERMRPTKMCKTELKSSGVAPPGGDRAHLVHEHRENPSVQLEQDEQLRDLEARIQQFKQLQESIKAEEITTTSAASRKRPRSLPDGLQNPGESLARRTSGTDSSDDREESFIGRDGKPMSKNACKRSRTRRKAVMDDLSQRNKNLEDQRHIYLERIAELQMKLLYAQHATGPDMHRENMLLRNEVSKYKALVQKTIAATASAPPVLEEERIRELRAFTNESVNRIAGLLQSSKDWISGPPIASDLGTDTRSNVQLLPLGSEPARAKRCNVRVVLMNVPAEAHTLAEKYWSDKTVFWRNKIAYLAKVDSVRRAFSSFAPAALAAAAKSLEAELEIFKYTEQFVRDNGEPQVDLMSFFGFVRTSRTFEARDLLSVDDSTLNSICPPGPLKCPIVGCANGAECFERAGLIEKSDVELISNSRTHKVTMGSAFVPGMPDVNGNPRCHVVGIFSTPLNIVGPLSTSGHTPLITDDGNLHKDFVEDFRSYAKLVCAFAQYIDRPIEDLPSDW